MAPVLVDEPPDAALIEVAVDVEVSVAGEDAVDVGGIVETIAEPDAEPEKFGQNRSRIYQGIITDLA